MPSQLVKENYQFFKYHLKSERIYVVIDIAAQPTNVGLCPYKNNYWNLGGGY